MLAGEVWKLSGLELQIEADGGFGWEREEALGASELGGRIHRRFPGTCPAESRPASEEECVWRGHSKSLSLRLERLGDQGASRRLTGPRSQPREATC